jgi:SpoVK/Ycf46/Vps4 family AAA+-type ATPase
MIDNEAWLELAEVSTDVATALHARCAVHHAIHLSLDLATIATNITPTTENESSSSSDSYQYHHQQQQPLTSVVLEAVECPSSRNGLIHLHPLLWKFLVYAADSTTRNTTHSTDKYPLVQKDFLSHEEAKENGSVSVKIVPLPIDPFLDPPSMVESDTAKQQHHPWRIRPVPIRSRMVAGNAPIKVDLSCIYLDPEILTQLQHNRDGPGDSDILEALLSSALQGRLVMANSITILNSKYGVAIVMISSIIESGITTQTRHNDTLPIKEEPEKSRDDPTMAAIRLGAIMSYMVKVNNKIDFLEENCNVNGQNFPEDDHPWEPTIPGYETLLQELMGMFRLQYHTTGSAVRAAPSGILVTGCAGVGKSRLASCLAHNILSSSTHNSRGTSRNIHWVSVQELLFLASTETDLVETVLLPSTDCDLWVIDDLHLLARNSQDGEDLDGAGRDVEYMLVLNSILQSIDQVVGTGSGRNDTFRCSIVGIGQVAMRLPPELIKIGRLEKEITVLPPTQSQRMSIWESILPSDQVPSVEEQRKWSIALASATAGCVPSDLLRIYQDACTRAWARHTTTTNKIATSAMSLDVNSGAVLLEWVDLAEAAHACIPSQLAELDVTKPSRPIEVGSMTWEQLHVVSWKMFGGYGSIRKRVFRHVVAPWRRFLRKLDQDSSDTPNSTASSLVGIEPPPGVLFHGPSGCGKSLAAMCLAASLDLPVIQVRATDILDKWLGGSEALLRSLFARARAAAPCILFLDEIDAIAVNRAEDDTSDVSSRVLSTLLNELDGVSSGARQSRVLVVACTNRLEALDAALLRPGRLEEHVCLELPAANDLLEILERRVGTMPLDDTVQLPDLAQAFFDHNATGADVEGVCRDVCLAALRAAVDPKRVALSQHDFLRAIHRL